MSDLNKIDFLALKDLIDKAIFTSDEHQPIMAIVDYGCGDGARINFLARCYPFILFIDYDRDKDLVCQARAKQACPNIAFFDDLQTMFKCFDVVGPRPEETAILLSSVLYKVYNNSSCEEIDEFWNMVNRFGYVIVNDLFMSSTAHRRSTLDDIRNLSNNSNSYKLIEFQQCHGSIIDNYNLIHFLIRSVYEKDLNQEDDVDYFLCGAIEVYDKLFKYNSLYTEGYILPYFVKKIKKRFNIDLRDNTCIKFIFKKENPAKRFLS